MDEKAIKQIEDLSLNAWPSHKMELYDGWILRFSYFYTHRTNSVEQFGEESLPWSVKIPFCEKEYARLGSPAIFKISPLVSPNFDFMLENRGYQIEHTTLVMTKDLTDPLADPTPGTTDKRDPCQAGDLSHTEDLRLPGKDLQLHLSEEISPEWIEGLFHLKNTTNSIHRRVVPSMYQAIPKETVSICIRQKGAIAATGLGILDRDFIGIYAIHVQENLRRLGLAAKICTTLLKEGQKRGAQKAYLQVVEGNTPARKLYEALGFHDLYRYWFRVENRQ